MKQVETRFPSADKRVYEFEFEKHKLKTVLFS